MHRAPTERQGQTSNVRGIQKHVVDLIAWVCAFMHVAMMWTSWVQSSARFQKFSGIFLSDACTKPEFATTIADKSAVVTLHYVTFAPNLPTVEPYVSPVIPALHVRLKYPMYSLSAYQTLYTD
jgi:hypothetical protein